MIAQELEVSLHMAFVEARQQREQQVLDGDELVPLLARFDKRHVQTDFQFLRDHAASKVHCSGCPARLAAACTSSTLVAATSLL